MMDKKEIENYLKIYPRIDEEIKSLEEDIAFFEDRKNKYSHISSMSQDENDMLRLIENGLREKKKQLAEHFTAKVNISKAMSRMDDCQKKIIQLRFWNNGVFTTWDEVARKMNISKRKAAYLYGNFVDSVNN